MASLQPKQQKVTHEIKATLNTTLRSTRKTIELYEVCIDYALKSLKPSVADEISELMEEFNNSFESLKNKKSKKLLVETTKLKLNEIEDLAPASLKSLQDTLDEFLKVD